MTAICALATGLALLAYLAAAALYPAHLLLREERWGRWGRRFLFAGASLHAVGLMAHLTRMKTVPSAAFWVVNAVFFFSLLTVWGGLWLEHRFQRPLFGVFLAPVVFLVLLYPLALRRETATGFPLPVHPWIALHATLALLSYASFALAFGAALIYLLQDRLLRTKRLERLRFFPALEVMDRAAYHLIALGFPLLTLGLIMGLIWLRWGRVASLTLPDPKIILAGLTWLIYAAYLYLRAVIGWYGRRPNWLLVVGFGLVLLTFLGTRHHFRPKSATMVHLTPIIREV